MSANFVSEPLRESHLVHAIVLLIGEYELGICIKHAYAQRHIFEDRVEAFVLDVSFKSQLLTDRPTADAHSHDDENDDACHRCSGNVDGPLYVELRKNLIDGKSDTYDERVIV